MEHTPNRMKPADALVIFGVTGDLAHKMIFPALYAMAKRGALNVPVVGVAASKLSLAQLRKRVTDSIKQAGKVDDRGDQARVIVEKPFGRDLASAGALNRIALSVFAEDSIFRIDYYLGKEAIMNIVIFPFRQLSALPALPQLRSRPCRARQGAASAMMTGDGRGSAA